MNGQKRRCFTNLDYRNAILSKLQAILGLLWIYNCKDRERTTFLLKYNLPPQKSTADMTKTTQVETIKLF